jgi:hypothetical protein
MITQERLRAVLHYDPETGVFTRRIATANRSKVGEVVGSDNGQGYLAARLDGPSYKLHRLAWLYMTGEWPSMDIDHKNGVRDDNRWSNLRHVPRRVNSQNQRRAHRDNATGFLGVSAHGERFAAKIESDGVCRRLGLYDTPEEAHAVYLRMKRTEHAGCTV